MIFEIFVHNVNENRSGCELESALRMRTGTGFSLIIGQLLFCINFVDGYPFISHVGTEVNGVSCSDALSEDDAWGSSQSPRHHCCLRRPCSAFSSWFHSP